MAKIRNKYKSIKSKKNIIKSENLDIPNVSNIFLQLFIHK